jgi:hypothetical protein
MAAVVNVLQFKESPDPALFERAAEELGPRMREVPGFQGLHVVRSGEAEVVLIILADSTEILDDIATRIGSPWMVEHIMPLLALPPQRHLGDVVASATA